MRCSGAEWMGLIDVEQKMGSDLPGMPSTTACVHCGSVGNVRWERVITGAESFIEYYCGRCEHEWRVNDRSERRFAPRATPKKDRSRDDR